MQQNKCPNCGAPLLSNKCDYCDSVFIFPNYKQIEESKERIRQLEFEIKQMELNSLFIKELKKIELDKRWRI